MTTPADLVFLKLGGSLITDKDRPYTPRQEVIDRLAGELASARAVLPHCRLILGHGSGSFGHTAAKEHRTREGVATPAQWLGFVKVWQEARALNEIVVRALLGAGLPVIAFPPSAAVTARAGRVERWDLGPIRAALDAGLIPLINGDTIFDLELGGTILSTEDLFLYLARQFAPRRILLAGIEPGVWADFPARARLLDEITPESLPAARDGIRGSASADVTGGMVEKVRSMLALVDQLPGFEAAIFSGLEPGAVTQALAGSPPGTIIRKRKENQVN